MTSPDKTALLVGATGMLCRAAREIAARAPRTAVLSRNASRRTCLEATLALDADWHDEDAFARALDAAAGLAPFSHALIWMHPRAEAARRRMAELMADGGVMIEVFGSRASRPGALADTRLNEMRARPAISYRQVRLGFVMEKTASRWLTPDEICDAAIHALNAAAAPGADNAAPPVILAGTLEPWEARPAAAG